MREAQAIYEFNDKLVFIYQDDDPTNPREAENIANLWMAHRRYTLGDKDPPEDFKKNPTGLYAELMRDADVLIAREIYGYDHGDLTIRLKPYWDTWDSGCLGLGVVRKSRMIAMGFDEANCTKEEAEKILETEVKEYDQFLTGDIYCFKTLQGRDMEESIDSGNGYFGSDFAESGLLASALGGGWESAKRVPNKRELAEAKIRVRDFFEAREDLGVSVSMPDPHRPGWFVDTPCASIKAGRALLGQWYGDTLSEEVVGAFLRWNQIF
jgi:hypothetical protein